MRWFHRLELKGYLVGDYRDMIMSWPARKAGQAIRVVIKTLPKNGLEEAIEKLLGRGFKRPHPEVACLLREVLDDNDVKSMGFDRIVVMHEPIANRYDVPQNLIVERCWNSDSFCCGRAEGGKYEGVAFEV